MGEYDKRPSKQASRATAGPSADDRFGPGEVCTNAQARILKADVVGDRTQITIAKGKSHGARMYMEGYVRAGIDGILSEFQLHDVRDNMSLAFVDVTPDQLAGHLNVIINPTSKPRVAITNDTPTRVLSVTVEGGRTKIIIARGSAQGVTFGMRGHLRALDGREGESFTIEGTTATQAFAYVANTVDHVQSHRDVVLHPNASPRAPIQRRANGAASPTAAVQTTAQAGVAGASDRLPHFDTIQRAFGKHDVSGVKAQVGGAATDASAALGAQAYATGNQVAFASSPDLHTAAHEAAHVIQQQRGAVGFQGLGAADDEHERHADAVADAVVAGQSAEPLLDHLRGIGTMAVQRKTQGSQASREDYLDVIANSYLWLNDEVQRRLDTLRRTIKEADPPPWHLTFATTMLNVALSAGSAAVGVYLSDLLVRTIVKRTGAQAPGEATKEFMKMSFEMGLGEGITAGREKLARGRHGDVVDPFMDAQQAAVAATQQENQKQFLLEGRKLIATREEAETLEETYNRPNIVRAAEKQVDATRDSWVSYLAQTKYGAAEDGVMTPAGLHKLGRTTTNMQHQHMRDRVNESAPGFVPERAPNLWDAKHGNAPGVLFVVVELPAIKGGRMMGAPNIRVAILNGVNEAIREQYAGVPLSALRIPRQIIAEVEGAPNFTLNVDEAGNSPSLNSAEKKWLIARATVDHPEHASKDDFEKYIEGRRLLLADLTPSSIVKRIV